MPLFQIAFIHFISLFRLSPLADFFRFLRWSLITLSLLISMILLDDTIAAFSVISLRSFFSSYCFRFSSFLRWYIHLFQLIYFIFSHYSAIFHTFIFHWVDFILDIDIFHFWLNIDIDIHYDITLILSFYISLGIITFHYNFALTFYYFIYWHAITLFWHFHTFISLFAAIISHFMTADDILPHWGYLFSLYLIIFAIFIFHYFADSFSFISLHRYHYFHYFIDYHYFRFLFRAMYFDSLADWLCHFRLSLIFLRCFQISIAIISQIMPLFTFRFSILLLYLIISLIFIISYFHYSLPRYSLLLHY